MTSLAFLASSSFCQIFNAAIITLPLFPLLTVIDASSCNGPCQTLNDCAGQLVCINGKCNDDPQTGTHTCSRSGGESNCNSRGPNSPPIIPTATAAILTFNDFGPGGGGGGPSQCDGKFHSLPERVVALSTGWYNHGSRCGKMIRITARNEKSAVAKVVDECDSVHGCDKEHGFQPPCKINVVDASEIVWDDLEMDSDKGEVAVTWSILP